MLEFEEITPDRVPDIKERIRAYNRIIIRGIYERRKGKDETSVGRKYIDLDKRLEKQILSGEIVNVFTRQYLDGQIKTARWALALAMLTTLLFKGFWAYWIVFISIYCYEVRRFRNEALEHDRKKLAESYKK